MIDRLFPATLCLALVAAAAFAASPDEPPSPSLEAPEDEVGFLLPEIRMEGCVSQGAAAMPHATLVNKALEGVTTPTPLAPGNVEIQEQRRAQGAADKTARLLDRAWTLARLEIEAAEIVRNTTADPHLTTHALRTLSANRQIVADLEIVAACTGHDLPEELPPDFVRSLQWIRSASGPVLEHRFLLVDTGAHERAIWLYAQFTHPSTAPTVSQFVEIYRPVLQIGLHQAQSLLALHAPTDGEINVVSYFDRHGLLGFPRSRDLPAEEVQGPSPGGIPVMPSNRQPDTTTPYHLPPEVQMQMGGSGLGPEPAPPLRIEGQPIPRMPDAPPYYNDLGIPGSQVPGVPMADEPAEVSEEWLAAFRSLPGRDVIDPRGRRIGEIERVEPEPDNPAASQLIIKAEEALGVRRYAVSLGDLEVPATGPIPVDLRDLAAAGDLTDLNRPPTPPEPEGEDAPARALPPPPTAGTDSGGGPQTEGLDERLPPLPENPAGRHGQARED